MPAHSAADRESGARRVERRGTLPRRPTSRRVLLAARLGFAARGVVFIGIGLAAATVAVGLTTRPRGAVDVIRVVARLPLGQVMLGALAVGLVGYAALSIAGAVQDPFGHGRSVRGWLTRGADALAGALYVSLAATAVRLIAQPGRGAGRTAAEWAARVLALPLGALWLGALGAGLLGTGAYLLVKARRASFDDRLDRRVLTLRARRRIVAAARVGTAVRGALFGLCGATVVAAAAQRQPERVADLGDALAVLGDTAAGPWLLAAAAVGFAAYGVYQLAKARYRRVH